MARTPDNPDEPIITMELWRRLRAFDGRCFISIQRRAPVHISPYRAQFPRVWMTEVRPLDERAYDKEEAEHPQFVEAVRLIVEKGEQRGWHRPKS